MAVALGGLGSGLQKAGDDWQHEQDKEEAKALEQSRYKETVRRDSMSEALRVAAMGGVIGPLDQSRYDTTGQPLSPGALAAQQPSMATQPTSGLSAQRPGSYVGQSTASAERPYATEHNPARPMKKLGTLNDQDVWVPADGMTETQFDRERDRRQRMDTETSARALRRQSAGKFKYIHPGEGELAALDDPDAGPKEFESLLQQERLADPATQRRLVEQAGARAAAISGATLTDKKNLKAAPGANQPSKDVNNRRVQLEHQATGVTQQLGETDKQVNQLRSQYNYLLKNPPSRRDTAAYGQYQEQLSGLTAALQPGAPWPHRADSLRHVTDSLRGEQQSLPAIGGAPGADAVPGLLTPAPTAPTAPAAPRASGGSVLRGGGQRQAPGQAVPPAGAQGDSAQKELEEAHILYHRNQNHPGAKEAYDQAVKEIVQKYSAPQQ